jgi:hypothetical protein
VVKSIEAKALEAIRTARAEALAKTWDAGARPEELILDITLDSGPAAVAQL